MVKRQKAFSLIELLVSMMIIGIIGGSMLPVITKGRPNIASQTLKGQFGCWWGNDGKLYEQYYDERSARSAPNDVTATGYCTLKFDMRPANFYIAATGAGSNNFEGQFATFYSPVLYNTLKVYPGRVTGQRDTLIKIDDASNTLLLSANGALDGADAQIRMGNVKSCTLYSSTSCTDARRCNVSDDGAGGYSLTLSDGTCDASNMIIPGVSWDDKKNIPLNYIDYNDVSLLTSDGSLNLMNNAQAKVIANSDNAVFSDGNNSMQFTFKDDYFIPVDRRFGFINNLNFNPNNSNYVSKFALAVETISSRRQTALIENFSYGNQYRKTQSEFAGADVAELENALGNLIHAGAPKRTVAIRPGAFRTFNAGNGAVLVIW